MGRTAAAIKSKDDVSQFQRGLILSMKDCVDTHIAHARPSVCDRSSVVVHIPWKVEGKLQDIVSSQSVFSNGLSGVSRVPLCRDLLLLFWIDATPDGASSAMRAFYEVQAAKSSPCKSSMTSPGRSTKRRKISTMWSRLDASRVLSDAM